MNLSFGSVTVAPLIETAPCSIRLLMRLRENSPASASVRKASRRPAASSPAVRTFLLPGACLKGSFIPFQFR